MIGGALAGIMHGSFRRDGTSQYLSISMPNTFSMSPNYVKKYIEENQLIAPDQDVFECLRTKLARLYLDAIDGPDGDLHEGCLDIADARSIKPASVDLVVTSRHTSKLLTTELLTGFVYGSWALTRSAASAALVGVPSMPSSITSPPTARTETSSRGHLEAFGVSSSRMALQYWSSAMLLTQAKLRYR